MAILAILPHVREDRLHMALRALHPLVHAAQRIFCFVVIELGNGLDGPPGRGRMAVFTRNRKRPVRTPTVLPLGFGRGSTGVSRLPYEEQQPAQDLNKRARNCPFYIRLPTIRLRQAGGCSKSR
jgi:hypothetical protein